MAFKMKFHTIIDLDLIKNPGTLARAVIFKLIPGSYCYTGDPTFLTLLLVVKVRKKE